MRILELFQQFGPALTVAFIAAFIAAISVHEWAHAWVANRLGDDTPRLYGRVTLNPRAHIDPVGGLLFLLVGFGWGRPVIYNPVRLKGRFDELWIALAGPAINLLFAFLCNVIVLGLVYFANQVGSAPTAVVNFIGIIRLVASINVMLAAFNLLPIPPLDGSSIIAAIWPSFRSLFAGQLGLILLLVLLFFPTASGGSLLSIALDPVLRFFTLITMG